MKSQFIIQFKLTPPLKHLLYFISLRNSNFLEQIKLITVHNLKQIITRSNLNLDIILLIILRIKHNNIKHILAIRPLDVKLLLTFQQTKYSLLHNFHLQLRIRILIPLLNHIFHDLLVLLVLSRLQQRKRKIRLVYLRYMRNIRNIRVMRVI